MADSQEIFYASISKYYSDIFPYNPMQLSFVQQQFGNLNGKHLLDVGCATGELSAQLAKQGARVCGIDLSADLLQQAGKKETSEGLSFREGNMLHLQNDFGEAQFDGVICFGNTLVHLNTLNEVRQALDGMRYVLKPGGQLLLQILNYDHILDNRVNALPKIENDVVVFNRYYDFENDSWRLQFRTELTVKSTGRCIENTTPLLALKSSALKSALQQSGFTDIALYSNFKRAPFGGNHLPLVLACQ